MYLCTFQLYIKIETNIKEMTLIRYKDTMLEKAPKLGTSKKHQGSYNVSLGSENISQVVGYLCKLINSHRLIKLIESNGPC